jgi:hypothetical protein
MLNISCDAVLFCREVNDCCTSAMYQLHALCNVLSQVLVCLCNDAHTNTNRSSTCESTDSLAELALTSPVAKARAQQLHAYLSANTSDNATTTTSGTTAASSSGADAAATAAGAAAGTAAGQYNINNSSSKLSATTSTSASDTPDVTAADVTEREGRVTSFGKIWPPPRYSTVRMYFKSLNYKLVTRCTCMHAHCDTAVMFVLMMQHSLLCSRCWCSILLHAVDHFVTSMCISLRVVTSAHSCACRCSAIVLHCGISRRNSLPSDAELASQAAEAAADTYADSEATADNDDDDNRDELCESLLDDNTTRRSSTLGGLLGVFRKGSRASGSLSTDSSNSSSSSSSGSDGSGGVSHSSSHSSLSEVELQEGEDGVSHPLIQTVEVVTEVRT